MDSQSSVQLPSQPAIGQKPSVKGCLSELIDVLPSRRYYVDTRKRNSPPLLVEFYKSIGTRSDLNAAIHLTSLGCFAEIN